MLEQLTFQQYFQYFQQLEVLSLKCPLALYSSGSFKPEHSTGGENLEIAKPELSLYITSKFVKTLNFYGAVYG